MADEQKTNLKSDEVVELKDKALDFLRTYQGDGETLRQNREDALKAYRRDPYREDAKIPDGSRSKFVMSDTADTIEWILPSLMRIFYSGKEVVKLEGQGPEDEKGAELLNEKVNWDFTRQNNGFLILYDWFKASMLNKFSVVKYRWESEDLYTDKKFKDVSDGTYQQLLQDPAYTIDKHEPTVVQPATPPQVDPMTGMALDEGTPEVATHNITARKLRKRVRRPVAEVVPPEEFVCSLKMRDLKTEEFYAHGPIRIHKFDLMKKYGLSEAQIDESAPSKAEDDREIYERFKDLGGIGFYQDDDDPDFKHIYECYMYDEERNPIILTILGNGVIKKQDNDGSAGFCLNSPIRMPHRAIGMSIYDLVGDLQKLRSMLARFILNNIYYQTDGMLIVDPWKINVADFVTQRRPGGVVRTSKEGVDLSQAVYPVPVQPLAGHAFGLLESIEGWKENRTGVTRYNQGMNADSLNKTARGISEIMAASQQRIELIARIFAETGVRDLLMAFADMNVKHLDIATNIRLNQEWKLIDPAQIDVQFDCSVDVALGTGSKEVEVQQIGQMLDRSLNPIMIQTGIVQPENLYAQMKAMWVAMGHKNTEAFLTDPATLMPVMPPGMAPPNGLPGLDQGSAGPASTGVPQGPPDVGPSTGAAY